MHRLVCLVLALLVIISTAQSVRAETCKPGDGHAYCRGYACAAESIGATTLDVDKKNVIGCLQTDEGPKWKLMSVENDESGATGGCFLTYWGQQTAIPPQIRERWGKGCKASMSAWGGCPQAADVGYNCGMVGKDSYVGEVLHFTWCMCAKNS